MSVFQAQISVPVYQEIWINEWRISNLQLYTPPDKLLETALKRLEFQKIKKKRINAFSFFLNDVRHLRTNKNFIHQASQMWRKLESHDKKWYQEKAKYIRKYAQDRVVKEKKLPKRLKPKGIRTARNLYAKYELRGANIKKVNQIANIWTTADQETKEKYIQLYYMDVQRSKFEKQVLNRFQFILRLLKLSKCSFLKFNRQPFECFRNQLKLSLIQRGLYHEKTFTEVSKRKYKDLSNQERCRLSQEQKQINMNNYKDLLELVISKSNVAFGELFNLELKFDFPMNDEYEDLLMF